MSKTKWSKTPNAKHRRRMALERLENQLKTGKKVTKEGLVDLSDKDKARIGSEMGTLKVRL